SPTLPSTIYPLSLHDALPISEVRRGFRAAHGARAASDPGRLRHLSAVVADCEFRHRHHGARIAHLDLLLLPPQVGGARGAADADRTNAAHAARLRRAHGSGAASASATAVSAPEASS